MENILKKEGKDIKEIFTRIKKRDFSGNTGIAIKNSVYQLSTNIFAKAGSMVFTILLARLLMPEVFGLYSLALSTIFIFASIAELGINQTLIRFVSKEFGKKDSKAKVYMKYFGKIKIIFIFISAILLLIFAQPLASKFYQKPIFLALLAGVLYVVVIQMIGFFQALLQASNNFFSGLKGEIIFQVFRMIFVPASVVLAAKLAFSNEIKIFILILVLTFASLLTCLFLLFSTIKSYKTKVRKGKSSSLSKKQKIIANRFILATTVLVLSGAFFGNIDRVMLGRFVASEFIGYYTAAYSLIGALMPIIGFASMVLLPIFSRIKGKELDKVFKKAVRITWLISIAAFLGTVVFSSLAISIIYGPQYSPSSSILRVLSFVLLILPVAGIYQVYIISQGKPALVSRLLVTSTLLNMILNYIFIIFFLKHSPLAAVYGAAIATILSQIFYFAGLVLSKRKIDARSNKNNLLKTI